MTLVKRKTYTLGLRDLKYNPNSNPLLNPQEVRTSKRLTRSGYREEEHLINATTGEIQAVSRIHELIEKDEHEFVKVFAAGIAAAYDLTKAGQKTFTAILALYEQTPMRNGFAEAVYVAWFDGGLTGQHINMSKTTFNRGLNELLEKRFIHPKAPNLFWVNPALFFKGDRVRFIREYVKKSTKKIHEPQTYEGKAYEAKNNPLRDPNTVDLLTKKTDNEATT